MKTLRKKILGPITLLHLIVLSASIAAVSGVALLYYSWTIELTLAQTDVTFYRWSDGATANYIQLAYNFYVDVTTEDRNATWGIWNRGASDKTVYLWADMPYNDANIDYFYAIIKDDTGTQITWWNTADWSNTGENNAVSWTAVAGQKYTLHIILRGSTYAVGPDETIRLALRTDP